MFGSGVRIGMGITAAAVRQTRHGLLLALAACTVVAVGASARGAAECRIATATPQTAGTALWASAWPQTNSISLLILNNRWGRVAAAPKEARDEASKGAEDDEALRRR